MAKHWKNGIKSLCVLILGLFFQTRLFISLAKPCKTALTKDLDSQSDSEDQTHDDLTLSNSRMFRDPKKQF